MANFFPAALLLVLFFFNPLASEAATDSSLISSIDCGASEAYTDELGIQWTPDSSLINTGQPQTVPNASASAAAASLSRPLRTLRAFPSGRTNCYALPVPGGGQVLVRATFFYGNYDGKNSPPAFDLELDGSSWAAVEASAEEAVSEEAIYAVRPGGAARVCLVRRRDDGGLPFVSAIEVRAIGDDMYRWYDRSSSALVLALRTAAGLPASVRYPDDPFDRIWSPYSAPNGIDVVQNQATAIDTGIKDAPPAAVLQSAVTPAAGSNTIIFTAPLPSGNVTAYINLYFTEVAELAAGDNRSFQVLVDGSPKSDPFAPPFGGVTEIYMANFSASSRTQIALQPTADATLPPVISAVEAYVIIPLSAAAAGGGGGGGGGGSAAVPASDETNSSPEGERVPAGSAFGAGRKGRASFGNRVEVGRVLGIGVGVLVAILFGNFV